jgi:hypothetical protein
MIKMFNFLICKNLDNSSNQRVWLAKKASAVTFFRKISHERMLMGEIIALPKINGQDYVL